MMWALAVIVAGLAPPADFEPVDQRPCFARSEIGSVHGDWHRPRVERHTETRGLGVDSVTDRGWVRVEYPGCAAGRSVVVVVYDAAGRWMSIGRT